MVTQTKIKGKFYPLKHEEFIKLNKSLTQSELAVYLWLKTNDPFGERLVEADTKEIAKDLNVSRRTIQRALVKLREEKLIDLVITKFHYRISSKSASDNSNTSEVKERLRVATQMSPGDTDVAETISMSPKCHPCRQSDPHVAPVTPMSRSSSETPPEQEFQNPKTIKTNKKIQTNQTVEEKTFSQEEKQPVKEDERPRVGERRKGMREVVQNQVQDEESNKEKKLVSLAETLEEVTRGVVQKKSKIERTKLCTNERSKKVCTKAQKKKVYRAPEIPEELKEKLLELEIPLDSKVISAIASHHISQAYGACAHVENTWDTINNPRSVFLYQLPKQPIEKLGSRYSEEILNNIKSQNQAIEEERKDPEYQKRSSEFFAQIRGRASLGKEKKTSEVLDDDPWL